MLMADRIGTPPGAWRRASLVDDLRKRWLGRDKREIETPALLLDATLLDANITKMAEVCASLGKTLRPHAKAHKCSRIADKQVRAGAVGIACSTASEAEALVDCGIADVLVSTVVGSPAKARRMVALARKARVMAVVDSAESAGFLSDAARHVDTRMPVLLDVNIGQNRTGVEPGPDARVLAGLVAGLPGLEFAGLQGYDGQSQKIPDPDERSRSSDLAMACLDEARRIVRAGGFDVRVVSCAGTGTYALAGAHSWVTEVQPGAYVLMDHLRSQVRPSDFSVASTVLATVIGSYGDRVVLDVGTKSIATDKGQPIVFGYPDSNFRTAGDEHGILVDRSSSSSLRIGDVVELVSGHSDGTVNLHNVFFVVRDGRVEDIWPIEARGCSW